jgi:hypothetical protein
VKVEGGKVDDPVLDMGSLFPTELKFPMNPRKNGSPVSGSNPVPFALTSEPPNLAPNPDDPSLSLPGIVPNSPETVLLMSSCNQDVSDWARHAEFLSDGSDDFVNEAMLEVPDCERERRLYVVKVKVKER